MSEVLIAAQMRAIERAAIESGAVSGLELMERAGRGVVEAVFETWPALSAAPRRAVVLCGPGNNGGDGFVVARLLRDWGWEIELFLFGDPARLPPDARVNHERWAALGPVRAAGEIEDEDRLLDLGGDLFVDALFGTGLSRPIDMPSPVLGPFLDYSRQWLYGCGPPTVSVDLPSGMCSDSGRVLGTAMMAALTVSFHAAKIGHYLRPDDGGHASGATLCGKVQVADIGLPRQHRLALPERVSEALPEGERRTVWRVDAPHAAVGKRPWQGHKYSHGHVLVLSGGAARTGAARLAARGALRVGAGLVTVAAPEEAMQECAAQLTAIMLRRCDDAAALTELLRDGRLNALCLGPGLGMSDREAALVRAVLESGRRAVLDADALTLIAAEAALFGALHAQCVLTPHSGEFARLFPDIAGRLAEPATRGPAFSRVDAARAAASRAGCIVLLKGPDTVIAAPDGRVAINAALYDRAAPWLATAGSGDVLAGLIAGLLARGLSPMQAAEAGAWLHVEAARAFGPGLIAEDLPETLPSVLRDLES